MALRVLLVELEFKVFVKCWNIYDVAGNFFSSFFLFRFFSFLYPCVRKCWNIQSVGRNFYLFLFCGFFAALYGNILYDFCLLISPSIGIFIIL